MPVRLVHAKRLFFLEMCTPLTRNHHFSNRDYALLNVTGSMRNRISARFRAPAGRRRRGRGAPLTEPPPVSLWHPALGTGRNQIMIASRPVPVAVAVARWLQMKRDAST